MARGQDRFEIRKELGSGGFGSVKLAYDRNYDRLVAIKVPHDKQKELALEEEAKMMDLIRDLRDHHLVMMRELAEFDGKTVLVMEFVDGESLRKRLGDFGRQKALPVADALSITIQVCQGLQTLHTAKIQDKSGEHIFHRDIKPENLLIRKSDGVVQISDFGISTILESSGIALTLAGTAPYMCPELLGDSRADCRADIYALGVTLYEMLTGRLPFDPFDSNGRAKGRMAYDQEICRGHPKSPSVVAKIPEQLSGIVLRAMDCDVERRYQSAQELREALQSYEEDLSLDAAVKAALEANDPAAQEKAFSDIAQRFPTRPHGYQNLARLYSRQGRVPESLQVLQQGQSKCAACVELLMELATAQFDQKQYGQAIKTLQEAKKRGLQGKDLQKADTLLNACRKKA